MKKMLFTVISVFLLGFLMAGCTTFGISIKEVKNRTVADERHMRLEELKGEIPESACKKVKKYALDAIRAGQEIIEIYHYLVLCGEGPLMRDEKLATADALVGAAAVVLESRMAAHYAPEGDFDEKTAEIVQEVLEISWSAMEEAAGLLAKL